MSAELTRLGYTVSAFAEVLGISTRTVYRWIDAKKIRCKKIAGRWFIPVSQLEFLLNGGNTVGTALEEKPKDTSAYREIGCEGLSEEELLG